MKTKHTSAKRYLSEINRQLFLMGKDKNKLIGKISNDINSFSGENPDCTYDDIVKIFGKPSDFLSSVIKDGDVEATMKKIKTSRWIKCTVAVACALITVIISSLAIADYLDNRAFRNGYFIETIWEGDITDMPPGVYVVPEGAENSPDETIRVY